MKRNFQQNASADNAQEFTDGQLHDRFCKLVVLVDPEYYTIGKLAKAAGLRDARHAQRLMKQFEGMNVKSFCESVWESKRWKPEWDRSKFPKANKEPLLDLFVAVHLDGKLVSKVFPEIFGTYPSLYSNFTDSFIAMTGDRAFSFYCKDHQYNANFDRPGALEILSSRKAIGELKSDSFKHCLELIT